MSQFLYSCKSSVDVAVSSFTASMTAADDAIDGGNEACIDCVDTEGGPPTMHGASAKSDVTHCLVSTSNAAPEHK